MAASDEDTLLPGLAAFVDDLPFPLIVYRANGFIALVNRKAELFWKVRRETVIDQFNLLEDAQSVAQGSHQLVAQALAGEVIITEPVFYDTIQDGFEREQHQQLWLQATVFPIRTAHETPGYIGIMHQDVSDKMQQAASIDRAYSEIDSQRQTIQALSTPVIQIWDEILLLPLVGIIDSQRSMAITENLLSGITTMGASIALLDITAVPIVDTAVAGYLLRTARAAQLLGCDVALVGIRSEIALTMIQIGVDLSHIATLSDLKAGLAWAFRRRGLRVIPTTAPTTKRGIL